MARQAQQDLESGKRKVNASVNVDLGQRRRYLFLQGPPGPLFAMLGAELAAHGHGVFRINFNGGDEYDWPEHATNYRGTTKRWPLFVHDFMEKNAITDLILYGDCRPMHMAAHGMAKLRGVSIHVLEEGYIRPDWMTWEPDGVNGYSTLPKDPNWYLQEARSLPPIPDLPLITASFGRRARDSYWHYHRIVTGRWKYPFYRTHRPNWIIGEGFGWLFRFSRAKRHAQMSAEAMDRLKGRRYFVFPLQLSADYQIRIHSPFETMYEAAELVLGSFARHAPTDTMLLVKDHPLYCGFSDWGRILLRKAKTLGIAHRLVHVYDGDLQTMIDRSLGMVCVNSTAATLALAAGKPVKTLGEAVYDMPGITDQQRLDHFWTAPLPPQSNVYSAFCRVLYARCLVRGGLASESAVQVLANGLLSRLETRARPALMRVV